RLNSCVVGFAANHKLAAMPGKSTLRSQQAVGFKPTDGSNSAVAIGPPAETRRGRTESAKLAACSKRFARRSRLTRVATIGASQGGSVLRRFLSHRARTAALWS